MPYFKSWARAVAALPLITDIPNLWGYWRSDTGVNGKLAARLDGSTEYLSNSESSLHFGDEDFSYFIVFNHDTVSGVDALVSRWEGGTGDRSFYIGINGNKLRFYIDSLGSAGAGWTQFNTTGTILSGSYYFAAFTHNSTTDTIRINCFDSSGTEVLDETTSHSGGAFNSSIPTLIGALDSTSLSNYWDGDIDQCVAFNKCIDTTEIEALVNGGSGLKYGDLTGSETFYSSIAAFYDFDSPKNFGRDSHQATHAVQLDGTNDYFKLLDANATDYNYAAADSFSIAFWIKKDSTTNKYILSKAASISPNRGWWVQTNSNAIQLYLVNDVGTSRVDVKSTSTMAVNTWYHCGVSYSGNSDVSGVKLYINGVLETNIDGNNTLSTNEIT